MREGLAAICLSTCRHNVVGQCADGWAALTLIQQLQPDIAILDINLPGLHPIEVIRQAKVCRLPTRIGVLSTRSDRKTVLEALRGGVNAFLLKSGPSKHLLDSIDQMLGGGVYISPSLNMDEIFLAREKPIPEDPFDTLSPREFQVFELLIQGDRPKDVAARLALSPKTIDTYRSSLMHKLGIHDVAGLVKYAMQRDFMI
ncbi:MAG: LuxR C-terminal-related transcriptional regulator [Bryobacteraceae bacterium]